LLQVRASDLAKAKRVGKNSTHFIIEVRGADLLVSLLNGKFKATYYKYLVNHPRLTLKAQQETALLKGLDECPPSNQAHSSSSLAEAAGASALSGSGSHCESPASIMRCKRRFAAGKLSSATVPGVARFTAT
jgi:hypothetical protein